MFIKPLSKYNRTTKERYTIYRLCESYRNNGMIRHRNIVGFGRLEELETVEQKRLLASRIEEMIKNGGTTLPIHIIDQEVEKLAQHFYQEIRAKKRYDVKADLTNTYFEGRMQASKTAKFGRMADCKTLEVMIETLSNQTSVTDRKPIVVMDAGIATNENVEMLKQKGYDYVCVTRSGLKDYHADLDCTPVCIKDKKGW